MGRFPLLLSCLICVVLFMFSCGVDCQIDTDCPNAMFCSSSGTCQQDCNTNKPCPHPLHCSDQGQCISLSREVISSSETPTPSDGESREKAGDASEKEQQKEETTTIQCQEGNTSKCFDGTLKHAGIGLCKEGLRTCVQGVWSSCQQQVLPSKEVCDNRDNDCDGQTDESLKRVCKGSCDSGEQTCSKGVWQPCKFPTDTVEVCDGKDNDCDGQTDEDFPSLGSVCSVGKGLCHNKGVFVCSSDKLGVECNAQPLSPGTKQKEVCDGKDNDCDGQVDEYTSVACYTGPANTRYQGACREGFKHCLQGKLTACIGEVLPEKPTAAGKPEACDGKDNNCNGEVDEKCACKDNEEQKCGSYPSYDGHCQPSYQYCNKGVWESCQGYGKLQQEVCDGKDNNCNGLIDEHLPHCYQQMTFIHSRGKYGIDDMKVSPDGKRIYLVDGKLTVYDVSALKKPAPQKIEIKPSMASDERAKVISFSPDGKHVAIGEYGQGITILEAKSLKKIKTFTLSGNHQRLQYFYQLSYTKDGKSLISSHGDYIYVWDVAAGKETKEIEKEKDFSLSNDGKYLLTYSRNKATESCELKLWNTSDFRKPLKTKTLPKFFECWKLAFSPDGKTFVASLFEYDGSQPNTYRVKRVLEAFETQSLKSTKVIQKDSQFQEQLSQYYSLSFSPNGKWIAIGADKAVIRNTKDWSIHKHLTGYTTSHYWGVRQFVFGPNSKHLFIANGDTTLSHWEMDTGKGYSLRYGHTADMKSIVQGSDSKYLFAGDGKGTTVQWDLTTKQPKRYFEANTKQIKQIALTPDDKTLVALANDEQLRFWDIATGKLKSRISFVSGWDRRKTISLSPTSPVIAVGSFTYINEGWNIGPSQLRFWNWKTGTLLRTISKDFHKCKGGLVSFSPDWKFFACGDSLYGGIPKTSSLLLFDTASGKLLKQLGTHEVTFQRLLFSPNGKWLAAGDRYGNISIWDVKTKTRKHFIKNEKYAVEQMSFSKDSCILATTGYYNKDIFLWDMETGKKTSTISGHMKLDQVLFSNDGKHIFASTFSENRDLLMWSTK